MFLTKFLLSLQKKDMAVIGIDFDNTISTHNYPFTGQPPTVETRGLAEII